MGAAKEQRSGNLEAGRRSLLLHYRDLQVLPSNSIMSAYLHLQVDQFAGRDIVNPVERSAERKQFEARSNAPAIHSNLLAASSRFLHDARALNVGDLRAAMGSDEHAVSFLRVHVSGRSSSSQLSNG